MVTLFLGCWKGQGSHRCEAAESVFHLFLPSGPPGSQWCLVSCFRVPCQAGPDCLSFILYSGCLAISLSQLYDGTWICSWGHLVGGSKPYQQRTFGGNMRGGIACGLSMESVFHLCCVCCLCQLCKNLSKQTGALLRIAIS